MLGLAIVILLADVAAPSAEPPKPEKLRCISEDVMGSLTQKRRTCHTEKEWKQIRDDSQGELEKIQNSPKTPNNG